MRIHAKRIAIVGSQVLITTALLGASASLPKGTPALDATVKAPKCVSIVDSHGKTLGVVSDIVPGAVPAVVHGFLQFEGAILPFLLEAQTILGVAENSGDAVYWTTPDCTGTPYILLLPTPDPLPPQDLSYFDLPYRRTTIAGPLKSLYAQVESSTAAFQVFQAYSQAGFSDCTEVSTSGIAVPAVRIFDISAEFEGPFRVANAACQ